MKHALTGAVLASLTLLSFFQFPGHTYLQSDSQIYAALLEHLRDPSALRQDMLVHRPHVSFTIYDEMALGLRSLTGLDFEHVLGAVQIVLRGLGIWGVYLMATAVGLAQWPALLVAAILSLGGTAVGPVVMIWEYEPIPRGFAVPLLLLAVGLVAHQYDFWAGTAASLAFLVHPPTVWPFWGIYFILALVPDKPKIMLERLRAFVPLLAAVLALFVFSQYQAGVGETQAFFSKLAPSTETLQRMRAPYVYFSIWWVVYWRHFLVVFPLALLAYWRIRRDAWYDLRFFLLGLPLLGAFSVPLSLFLLEHTKWALMPQIQPMRALLFVLFFAVFSAAIAGVKAAQRGRWYEAIPWFALAYLIPANTRVDTLPPAGRIAAIMLLAVGATLALRLNWRPLVAAVALVSFFLIPSLGKVQMGPSPHTRELAELVEWAERTTSTEAVFHFPDAGRGLDPGIFRARALRAVFVDWKGGGQVNYLPELGDLWWKRWQGFVPFRPADLPKYREAGIDYVVLTKSRLPGEPVFENKSYRVYSLD